MSSTTSQRISCSPPGRSPPGIQTSSPTASRHHPRPVPRGRTLGPGGRQTFLTDSLVVLGGEFHTVDPAVFARIRDEAPALVRNLLRDTGYSGDFPGIDPDRCEIPLRFSHQSADIRQGGAGRGDRRRRPGADVRLRL